MEATRGVLDLATAGRLQDVDSADAPRIDTFVEPSLPVRALGCLTNTGPRQCLADDDDEGTSDSRRGEVLLQRGAEGHLGLAVRGVGEVFDED